LTPFLSKSLSNLGARGCRKRELLSLAAFVTTIFVFLALKVYDVSRGWYIALFLSAFVAVLSLLQAREKT